MAIERETHIKNLQIALAELNVIQNGITTDADDWEGYLGTGIMPSQVIMYSLINLLTSNDNDRGMSASDEGYLHVAAAAHRSFFSTVHTAFEAGIIHFLSQRKVKVTSRRARNVDTILKALPVNVDPKVRKQITRLSSDNPSFDDHIEAVLEHVKLKDVDEKIWRKYFKALSIIRNKSSHANSILSEREVEFLVSANFAPLVNINNNSIHANFRIYPQIAQHILTFVKLVKSQV